MKGISQTDAQQHRATLSWLLNWPDMPTITLECRPTDDCEAKTRPCILCSREHHHNAYQCDGSTRWIAQCVRPAGLWGRELTRWWEIVDNGYRLRMVDYDDLSYEPYFEDERQVIT
jgi:hypothetical protein